MGRLTICPNGTVFFDDGVKSNGRSTTAELRSLSERSRLEGS